MPRLPGRESTRITVPLEFIEVGSFIGVWEKYAHGKRCCVPDCGHVISGRRATDEEFKAGADLYIQCEGESKSSGAATVYDTRDAKQRGHGLMICPCCLTKLDESWGETHGND